VCPCHTPSITGETITKYRKLIKDPHTKDIWSLAFGKEFGNLAQGDEVTGTEGTNSVFVISHDDIKTIPSDRVVTFARIVVNFCPQKKDLNRVRITADGSLIDDPGELTTRTADLTTSKILWNSVLSTEGEKFMGIDISNFYLGTPMDPDHIVKQYNLGEKAKNGFVYLELRNAIYGLPQAGSLANKLIKEWLEPHGYREVPHTPGLWKHKTRPVQFSLVVDDFGVK